MTAKDVLISGLIAALFLLLIPTHLVPEWAEYLAVVLVAAWLMMMAISRAVAKTRKADQESDDRLRNAARGSAA